MGPNPDAIVVGSGPAGVSAARKLLEGGKSVLMIDAGDFCQIPPTTGPLSYLRRYADDHWPVFLGHDLAALSATSESSPKLRTPTAAALQERYLQALRLSTENFVAAGALAVGGLSNFWGAIASVYSGSDLDGYPIAGDSLIPHVREIVCRIGVSGCRTDDLATYHGEGPLNGDLPVPAPIAKLLRNYEGCRDQLQGRGFILGRARNAVLTEAKNSVRNSCGLDNLCLWGCRRGAIYSSAFELAELERFSQFRFERNFMVQSLRRSNGLWHVQGEQARRALSVEAGIVLLAAGTIGTTRLVLDLMSWHDRPVALLTNPVFASAFVMPSLIGRRMPRRGFAMAQLHYLLENNGAASDYAAGALYLADGLPASEIIARLPFSRPAARVLTRALLPALVLTTCYLSSDYSDNWITLRRDGSLAVTGGHSSTAPARVAALRGRLRSAMRRLGLLPLPGEGTLSTPGSDFHYAGTMPMGGAGPLATTASGQLVGVEGLYVVDAACLSRLTAKHLTLTIMANSARIAEGIVQQGR